MTAKTSFENKLSDATWVRVSIKVLLGLLTACLAAVFFGICLPFFLLSMGVLPGLGVGGVAYLLVGAALGLILGGIAAAKTLCGSVGLISRSYLILTAGLALAIAVYSVCYINFEQLQRGL